MLEGINGKRILMGQHPGELNNLPDYVPDMDKNKVSQFFNAYKLEDFKKQIENAGFKINEAFYYDIKEPSWFGSDGKGVIAIIAHKPAANA